MADSTVRHEYAPRPTIPRSSVAAKFGRALLLRCPRCGRGNVLRGWLKLKEHCPYCGLALERGERSDFWLGAYVFNLVAGELLAIGIPVVWMIASSPHQPWTQIEILAIVLCVALPFVFFPFSRTLWLAWDLSFRPFEPGDVGRRTQ
ncbi:MAG TPA: DUF983 domain-containing protein [Kofleriaceae bacterium]|nr:DUF983 domain-containing protein [Kofleriaceae bacterium]